MFTCLRSRYFILTCCFGNIQIQEFFGLKSSRKVILNMESVKHIWASYIPEPFLTLSEGQSSRPILGARPALIVVDLYHLVFKGGDKPVSEIIQEFPASCGDKAYGCVQSINQVIGLFRSKQLPIWFSSKDISKAQVKGHATRRPRKQIQPGDYRISKEIDFQPQDSMIKKVRASIFFETHLHQTLKQQGINSLVIIGESTSGCVRASVVDAFSLDYSVTVIEDCVFDQNPVSHAVNLYDIHHKYATVCSTSELTQALI